MMGKNTFTEYNLKKNVNAGTLCCFCFKKRIYMKLLLERSYALSRMQIFLEKVLLNEENNYFCI